MHSTATLSCGLDSHVCFKIHNYTIVSLCICVLKTVLRSGQLKVVVQSLHSSPSACRGLQVYQASLSRIFCFPLIRFTSAVEVGHVWRRAAAKHSHILSHCLYFLFPPELFQQSAG